MNQMATGVFSTNNPTNTHVNTHIHKANEGVYGIERKDRGEQEKEGEKTGRVILSRPCDIYQ